MTLSSALGAMWRPRRNGKLDLALALQQLDEDAKLVGPILGHREELAKGRLIVDLHRQQVLRRCVDDAGLAELRSHHGVFDSSSAGRVVQRDDQMVDLATALRSAAVQFIDGLLLGDDRSRHEAPVQGDTGTLLLGLREGRAA